jgi:probable O-glycosylation ligase (exosortase A-associated)
MNITYLASYALEENYSMWLRVMKINLFMFVVSGAILTRRDIDLVIWTLVLALGVTGTKGGLFTLATGGSYVVWGPGGFIGGNNEFALALVMTIPLMYYLWYSTDRRWVKYALLGMMFLCSISVIGSQSRGALLAISAMGIMLITKSKQRLLLSLIAIGLTGIVLATMPDAWHERMGTIRSYEEDRSAMGRINAWTMAFNLASDRVFGSSFENVTFDYFLKYGLDTENMQGPHSIFFQVLGQHGFIGLFLFLGIGVSAWRCASRVARTSSKNTQNGMQDLMLAEMAKASFVGYAVGGAFLELAYFDMPYYLMIAIVKLEQLKDQAQSEQEGRQGAMP